MNIGLGKVLTQSGEVSVCVRSWEEEEGPVDSDHSVEVELDYGEDSHIARILDSQHQTLFGTLDTEADRARFTRTFRDPYLYQLGAALEERAKVHVLAPVEDPKHHGTIWRVYAQLWIVGKEIPNGFVVLNTEVRTAHATKRVSGWNHIPDSYINGGKEAARNEAMIRFRHNFVRAVKNYIKELRTREGSDA